MYIYKRLNAETAFDIAKKFSQYENVDFNQFKALFEYFENVLDETPIEFDPIAWICEFGLYTHDGALNDYDVDSLDELEEKTTLIKGDDFVWVLAF